MVDAQIWCKNGIANSTGGEIHTLIAIAGYKKNVDKPTHVVNNSFSWMMLFCVATKVYSTHKLWNWYFCFRQMPLELHIYGKINIRAPLRPDVSDFWDYSKVNIENINDSISKFTSNKTFL